MIPNDSLLNSEIGAWSNYIYQRGFTKHLDEKTYKDSEPRSTSEEREEELQEAEGSRIP